MFARGTSPEQVSETVGIDEAELAALFTSGDVPFVLVEVSRQRGGLLSGIMPTIEAHCSTTNVRGATSRFYQTWDCRPEAQTASR